MKVLRFILQKEFRQIFRDKSIFGMMFGMPIIQFIMLPLVADFEVKNVNVVYVDSDHSSYSRQLAQKINSSGYFHIVSSLPSYKEAIKEIEKGDTDVILEIPQGFERNLVREGTQAVNLSVDAINGTKSSLGGAYLSRVIQDFNNELDVNVKSVKNNVSVAKISAEGTHWYNPKMEYKLYMTPAILAILLTMIGGFLTSSNIVREKEIGTIEQINVTPIKKWEFILGKLIPFWVLGMVVFTLGLIIMYLIYNIFPAGSLFTLYAFAGIYMIAVLGFGLLISTYANSQLQAMFITFFFMMIFILMSGFFTSIDSMPDWAIAMANLIPVTHFMAVVRLIVLKGSGFADIYPEFLYLTAFAIVLNAWAIWNYKKTS